MVWRLWYVFLLLCITDNAIAQSTISPEFDARLQELLEFSIPVISVTEASENYADYIFLDARELEEYNVSHIPGARYIGYDHFKPESLKDIGSDQKIIIYCSVGYRSEKLGERLKRMGYVNVSNLYGSIFEWTNCGLPIENSQETRTDSIHTYNRAWSKWVQNPEIQKVW